LLLQITILLNSMFLNQPESYSSFTISNSLSYKKDYIQSPFRYPGGKFYALKFILPMLHCIPHNEYREPFVGGGSVFLGKSKVKFNWINDLDSDLIEAYLAISDSKRCEILSKRVNQEEASRERHNEIKLYQPQNRDDIAFKTYYLNRTSYSGIIHKPAWGYKIGKSSPPKNWGKFLKEANKKLLNIKITSLDFEQVIETPSNNQVLMYLDPPYYHADQKRAYKKSFKLDDHFRLENSLKKTRYYFCLSYDDCPEIRNLYKWANIYERKWFYNTANVSTTRKMGNELLITNYEVIYDTQLSLF
jgi:DNA adenine methylase